MAQYIVYLCSDFTGTAQQKDDAAFAAAQSLRARMNEAGKGDRPPQPDYPDDNNTARNIVPTGRGYAEGVSGAESVLTEAELAARVSSLPPDGDRPWNSVLGV